MIKRFAIAVTVATALLGCDKEKGLAELEANNIPFNETEFSYDEVINMTIPNDQFDFSGFGNCTSLPFNLSQDYNAFIPTVNPNPYAHLVENISPSKVQMELVNIPNCDFDMLESVEIYLCDLGITDENQFILYNPNNPDAPYNAVKIGEYLNFTSGVGDVIRLDLNEDAVIDQFVHAENFQTYAKMVFDKAFTEETAIIKTTMTLDVRLVNEG